MKLRHKDTGELMDLPDYLPDYHDAKEIARVFHDAAAATAEKVVPPCILCLKNEKGEIIRVEEYTAANSDLSYEKLIRMHLFLLPFQDPTLKNKSSVWTVAVNGQEWSVNGKINEHVINHFEWLPDSGWWAVTEGIYAINLNKLCSHANPPVEKKKREKKLSTRKTPPLSGKDNPLLPKGPRLMNMNIKSWLKKMVVN
jgi:hypothetical protein